MRDYQHLNIVNLFLTPFQLFSSPWLIQLDQKKTLRMCNELLCCTVSLLWIVIIHVFFSFFNLHIHILTTKMHFSPPCVFQGMCNFL